MRMSISIVAAGLAAVLVASCSTSSTPTAVPTTTTTASSAPGATAPSAASWTTYFHDSGRSGFAADGPAVAATVHRQWVSPTLDGDIYGQPLVVGDRVVVATENDTVYALNASSGATLWSRHLGSPVPSSSLPCGNVDPVGITSTPVVDVSSGRVYAVGLVQPGHDTLFALDLSTGAVVGSTGVDAPGSDPATDNQRGALAFDGGHVLVPFGGRFGDCGAYHGVVASVPVTAGGVGTASWYTLPTGREGGFWAPGGPVVAPDGSFYVTSGNSASSGSYDYGNSVVHVTSGLKLVDSFAPTNWAALNATDSDLGSTGPVLVGNRAFQVGKSGVGYLLDAGHLGGIGGQLAARTVCQGKAFGAVSRMGTTLFVPCDGVVAVSVAGDQLKVAWSAGMAAPGPVIVTSGAVWTVATSSGSLVALDLSTGHQVFSQAVGDVPSRFTSPAAGGGRVVVAAARRVLAFGD
jgi:outer membrane protein assembly factor BamB